MSGSQSPVGCRAVLVGLAKYPELNDTLVFVESHLTENDRFRVRPLGREARALAPSPRISVKGEYLRLVHGSAFIAKIDIDGMLFDIPSICLASRDGYGRVGLHIVFATFLGVHKLVPCLKAFEYECRDWTDVNELEAIVENAGAYCIPTSPIALEEIRQRLDDSIVMIIGSKHKDMYNAMLDFEIVKPAGITIIAGYWGMVELSKIAVSYDADQDDEEDRSSLDSFVVDQERSQWDDCLRNDKVDFFNK